VHSTARSEVAGAEGVTVAEERGVQDRLFGVLHRESNVLNDASRVPSLR
jgi:hypothetical protein